MTILENYAEIQRSMQEEIEDFPYKQLQAYSSLDFDNLAVCDRIRDQLQSEIRFDMTSVHDATLRDAWGKAIQGVMEMLPSVEQLLVNFTGVSGCRCWAFSDGALIGRSDFRDGQFVPLRHPVGRSIGGRQSTAERSVARTGHRVSFAVSPVPRPL